MKRGNYQNVASRIHSSVHFCAHSYLCLPVFLFSDQGCEQHRNFKRFRLCVVCGNENAVVYIFLGGVWGEENWTKYAVGREVLDIIVPKMATENPSTSRLNACDCTLRLRRIRYLSFKYRQNNKYMCL